MAGGQCMLAWYSSTHPSVYASAVLQYIWPELLPYYHVNISWYTCTVQVFQVVFEIMDFHTCTYTCSTRVVLEYVLEYHGTIYINGTLVPMVWKKYGAITG